MTDARLLLFTDFTWAGPYVGELHMAVADIAPAVPVFDLMHDAPAGDPRRAAYLLAALARRFRSGDICVAVVDPGVGGARDALALDIDGVRYIGPDNGLFELLWRRGRARECRRIDWRPAGLSATFHGRDLFAPAAAHLHGGTSVDGTVIAFPARPDWPDDLDEIIYIDGFGNAMTGLRAPARDVRLTAAGRTLARADTFADIAPGAAAWLENSLGLAEIAMNGAAAATALDLRPGDKVTRHPA